MKQRHKHADIIHAWAEGETIQQANGKDGDETFWIDWNITCGITPSFDYGEYRIKPKIVKKEGWVNVYPEHNFEGLTGLASNIHSTKELADHEADINRAACIRIEWEEEQ